MAPTPRQEVCPCENISFWWQWLAGFVATVMHLGKAFYEHYPVVRTIADSVTSLWLEAAVSCFDSCRRSTCGLEKEDDTQAEQQGTCCPRRRARTWRCAKRANRRRNRHDECPLVKFYKLHLPAPLPCWRRCRSTSSNMPARDTSEECDDTQKEEPIPMDASTSPTVDEPHAVESQFTMSTPGSFVAKVATVLTSPPSSPQPQRRPRAALIDLARMQQWEVILNTPLKRRDAKYRDADGLYPLHWASAGSPPGAVVERLLQVYPSAIRKADQEGSLPLHFAACYSASDEVITRLVENYPSALTVQDKYGRTPLYHATEKALRLSVLQLLSKDHPNLLTTPCHVKFQKTTSKPILSARQEAMRTPLHLVWTKVLSDRQCRLTYQGKTWDKAVWMLQAAHQHQHGETNGQSILMAAIRMDLYLPEPVVPLILAARPDLLRIPDPILPLSEAAGRRSYSLSRWERILEALLAADATAATTLPAAFHQAIRAGRPFAKVLSAAPQAMQWRDRVTGLPPALLAASVALQSNGDDDADSAFSWSLSMNDPFKLLLPKQREILELQATKASPLSQSQKKCAPSEDLRQTTAVYELLKANPEQILLHASA